MERYEELKTLGRGSFGVAILVRRRTAGGCTSCMQLVDP
jgi:hypothetical protein